MANENIILVAEVVGSGVLRPTPLNVRFDQQLLAPNITIAEQRWLVPLLGDALYADMVADQAAAATPPTTPKFTNVNYQALWDRFLWQYNARAVVYESSVDIGIQTGANGFYLNNTETSENAGVSGMRLKQDFTKEQLMTLQGSIKKYLCENKTLFPLYDADKNCNCLDESRTKQGRGINVAITEKMRQKR